MPKFKNKDTGSVVDVDDETAATLGREWAPFVAGKAVDGSSSQAQQRKLSKLLEAAGHVERAAKLAHLSDQLDRKISAWKDVTADEADDLIVELETGTGQE